VNAMAFFVWRQTRFLHYPARLCLGWARRAVSRRPCFSMRVSGLTKTQAEELLDWLEATGHQQRQLAFSRDEGFAVFYS
jgi:hypothetical protein